MADRDRQIGHFLEANGQGRALRTPLAGDASVRRYERLCGGGCPAILMDVPQDQPAAPPHQLDLRPFIRIGRWLKDRGWSAPAILAADPDQGLMLLEDLGDDLFSRCLGGGAVDRQAKEFVLYALAVDLLVALQRAVPPSGLPPYDADRMLTEAGLLTEWYAPALGKTAKHRYLEVWRELLPHVRVGAETFVYVDYHADNLVWLPAREGLARIGLLDFQDGRLGPPAYDLVSLLEDARRDVPGGLADAMTERYLRARPELDPVAFRRAYALLGAQRNCKILGLFSRLARRDGKPRYLALQDRVRGHLQRALGQPVLAPLAAWFDSHVELNIAS